MENLLQSPTAFNRYESMDSATQRRILDLISDLSIIENCNAGPTINYLYGAFDSNAPGASDGLDYGDMILAQHTFLNSLNNGGNTGLVNEILAIVAILKTYPRHATPNYTNL